MDATVEPTLKDVRLEFTPPTGAVAAHIWRVGESDVPADVRDWSNHAVTAGEVTVARDYEAPIGVELVYTAQFKNDSGGTVSQQQATITVASLGCADTWLNDLARAQNTMRIVVEQLPELAYVVPATVHEIITRRAPIVSSDVAHTPDFELSFLTATDDERERARATLGNGVPVLLRSGPEVAIGNVYMAVLGFAEQRVVSSGTVPDRRFVVSARQIDRPHPALYAPGPPTTFAEVDATFATLQELKDGRATWDAVLYDWQGEEAGDIVPWPPVDV